MTDSSQERVSLKNAFKDLRAEAADDIHHERIRLGSGERPWAYYGKSTPLYDITFESLLGRHLSFHDYLKEKRAKKQEQGHKLSVLDLGAPLDSFLSHQKHIDQGVAVTLVDPRSKLQREIDQTKSLTTIEANLVLPSSWIKSIDPIMEELGIKQSGFDIIIIRPHAGIKDSPENIPIYFNLLDRAYKRLSVHDGDMFIHLQGQYSQEPQIKQWIAGLSTSGLVVGYDGRRQAFKITRTPQSPSTLPSLADIPEHQPVPG